MQATQQASNVAIQAQDLLNEIQLLRMQVESLSEQLEWQKVENMKLRGEIA